MGNQENFGPQGKGPRNYQESGHPQQEWPDSWPQGQNMQEKQKSGFGKGAAVGSLVTLFVVTAVLGGLWLGARAGRTGGSEPAVQEETTQDAVSRSNVEKKVGEIAGLIDQYYYDEIDENALVEGMYAGMVEGLGDPYSAYYTAEDYKSLTESTSGVYYGIGAVLTQNINTKVVTILHVYPGTPAEEAGVKDGDMIVKVGEIAGDSMELSELVTHIKGEEGTTVHLELLREGEENHEELDVVRRQIEVPTVQHQMLQGNVGFVQVSEFSESTPEQFEAALQELQGQGMKSVIVDLRDNPGGVLQSVCKMLDLFLPEGVLVYTEDKYGNRTDFKSDKTCMEIPMAVLINGNSASASEIFAGAIKDYKYGTLVGTTSFGKGIVQTIVPMDDGSAVKVTMAKYFTPNGNYIHDVGISPDIELEYEYQGEQGEEYDPMHDNQVLKALEILK